MKWHTVAGTYADGASLQWINEICQILCSGKKKAVFSQTHDNSFGSIKSGLKGAIGTSRAII